VGHHAHGLEKSVWPLTFDGVIPASQQCGTTLRVGRKSVKELPSLSYLSHTLLFASKKYAFGQKYHDTDRQAHLYPDTRELPQIRLASKKIAPVFLFLQKVWTPTAVVCQVTTKVPKVTTLDGADTHREKGRSEVVISGSHK
jgi:hypothetical protein